MDEQCQYRYYRMIISQQRTLPTSKKYRISYILGHSLRISMNIVHPTSITIIIIIGTSKQKMPTDITEAHIDDSLLTTTRNVYRHFVTIDNDPLTVAIL